MRALTTMLLVAGSIASCKPVGDGPEAQRDAQGPEYTVRPAEGGGFIVDVPAVGVSAWLPGEPTRHAGHSMKPFGFQPIVELAGGPPEMGCALSWYPTGGGPDPQSKLDEVRDEQVRLFYGKLKGSGDVPFGDGRAKEVIIAMTYSPNVGTARERFFIINGYLVLMHTFVLKSERVDPVIVRCLESVTARGADGKEIKAPPVPERL